MVKAVEHRRAFVLSGLLVLLVSVRVSAQLGDTGGKSLYDRACASCHGVDGRGAARERVAFDLAVPDFTECSFSTRESDADWIAVVHEGGPVRGFDPTMPAFGEAFGEAEIQRILDYVRMFCGDGRWPRGELNLPRPFFTEKAYPEDEAVSTVSAALEGARSIMNELLYERRVGARSQFEVAAPFGVREVVEPGGSSRFGLGDIELGVKHALWHSAGSGTILSVGGELLLPTGDDARGFGRGTVVVEPFLSFGQVVATDGFVQAQALLELPVDQSKAENEAGLRLVAGRTFTQGRWGRTWSPMLEVIGAAELESGELAWDIVPQMQVSLNTRQHVLLNLGVRLPVTDTRARSSAFVLYVLWDWFDGGLFDGW
jgi:hypothetical protein